MAVYSSEFQLSTQGWNDVHDVTPKVTAVLSSANIQNGIVTVFVPGSTAGITTIEYEQGVVEDLKSAINRLIPQNMHYSHDARWGDGNGFAHVRASLIGPSIAIPVVNGDLRLGTWQQIVVIDFDNRPRTRKICVSIVGE
jgi:secondary thiamine-phosphate synthase enzyme